MLNNVKNILILLLLIVPLPIILFISHDGKISRSDKNDVMDKESRPYLIIKNIKLPVLIADTAEKRTKGLSGRPGLGANEGMFFIFDMPEHYSFWMKEMNFPIDIIWINSSFKIVDITKNVVPESYPNSFSPGVPVKYVLETIAGWTDKNGVVAGDTVLLNE